jgi:hypothetical protein
MDPATIGVISAIVFAGVCIMVMLCQRVRGPPIPRLPSAENLGEMEIVEDPTQKS